MKRKTDEELRQLAREYRIELTISKSPLAPKGEIMLLPGIRPRPTDGEEPKR